MSRTRSAREGSFATAEPSWGALRKSFSARFLTSDQLRRLLPALTLGFLVLCAAGCGAAILHAKHEALASSSGELALMADLAAANLKSATLSPAGDWQSALAASLPKGGTEESRVVLLADAEGRIRAHGPLGMPPADTLLAILGPQQPLTTFGDSAGVLEMTLTDGTEAIVTVRNIDGSDAQIALLQPLDGALASWRQEARIETTILILGGLLLILLTAAVCCRPVTKPKTAEPLSGEIVEALPGCGLWRWNLGRGHVHWSPTMYRLLGREPQPGPIGFGEIAAAIHPDDDLRATLDRHLREQQTEFDQSFRMRSAKGGWQRLRLRGRITRGVGESYLTAIATADDAAPGSSDANTRLRDAVENISEAFVLWDHQNRLIMCNSKYQQFHGLPDEMILPGTPYEEVIASASEPIIRKRIAVEGKNDEESRTYEAQLEDGRWLHINERRTKDGGYVSVGTDVTVLKESQQRLADNEQQLRSSVAELRLSRRELEQQKQQLVDLAEKYALEKNRAEAANRAKSEFLANISHELRTPLNAVIGFSEVMQKGLFGPIGHPKYAEYARDIQQSGAYLLEVINDILDMSKIEAGRLSLDIGTVDVADIIADSMKVVSQAAAERSIELNRHGPSRMVVEADRRALKQVFLNLLANAVKFTREDGSVDVHLSRTRGLVRIAIKDTGIGIPEADIAKLGRPFEQVENQFSKSHQGSGLGLAISRALLELHGGTLRISSREGHGTTVICTLPVKAQLSEPEAATVAAIA